MRRIVFFLCGLLLLTHVSWGQQFGYEAAIAPVPASGFYKIQVTPAITRHLQKNFADLRLYNRKNQEVPFLLMREKPVQTRKLFRSYEVVSKTIKAGVGTTLILRNRSRSQINNISLIIKNSNVRKRAKLSGSPDAQNWFGIEDQYHLQAIYNNAATAEVKILDFPRSDYEYYKLDINDSASAPLNILMVGYYDTQSENGKYTAVPGLVFKQTDSARVKKTYLRFSAATPLLVDKLVFSITGPTFYRREATLYQKKQRQVRRRRIREVYEPVAHLVLQSNNPNELLLVGFQAKYFYLEIENADNPPLIFNQVQVYQLNTYLIADLQAGQPYYFKFGNQKLSAPSYDLTYFKDKISKNRTVLTPKEVISLTQADNTTASNTFFKSKVFIWVAILLVIGFLGYMTYQMMKETGRNKT